MDKLKFLIKRAACEIRFSPTPVYFEKKAAVWRKFATFFDVDIFLNEFSPYVIETFLQGSCMESLEIAEQC